MKLDLTSELQAIARELDPPEFLKRSVATWDYIEHLAYSRLPGDDDRDFLTIMKEAVEELKRETPEERAERHRQYALYDDAREQWHQQCAAEFATAHTGESLPDFMHRRENEELARRGYHWAVWDDTSDLDTERSVDR